jgi:hypothetical protein
MLVVPIQDVYSQLVKAQLGGQNCEISIYQLSTGLFCDVSVDSTQIIGGVICQDRNRIVRSLYLGFIGDLAFIDTQGTSDPSSPGLGTRYLLYYLTPTDLGGAG